MRRLRRSGLSPKTEWNSASERASSESGTTQPRSLSISKTVRRDKQYLSLFALPSSTWLVMQSPLPPPPPPPPPTTPQSPLVPPFSAIFSLSLSLSLCVCWREQKKRGVSERYNWLKFETRVVFLTAGLCGPHLSQLSPCLFGMKEYFLCFFLGEKGYNLGLKKIKKEERMRN